MIAAIAQSRIIRGFEQLIAIESIRIRQNVLQIRSTSSKFIKESRCSKQIGELLQWLHSGKSDGKRYIHEPPHKLVETFETSCATDALTFHGTHLHLSTVKDPSPPLY